MTLRRILLWLGLLLLLGLPLLLLWLPASRTQTLKLPDGQVVTFLRVTYGTKHHYTLASPWLQPFVPVLPDKIRKRWGIHTVRHQSETSTLMLWCLWDTPPGTLNTTRHASVFSGDGTETEPDTWKAAAYPTGFKMIVGWEFRHFPRRSKTIGFRIYQRANNYQPRAVGQFQASNPARSNDPQWNAHAVPVSVPTDDFTFALTRFTVDQRIPERFQPVRGWTVPWATATFQVHQGDQLDLRWRIESVSCTDATGNWFSPLLHTLTLTNTGSVLELGFPGAFWRSEKAWKLTPEFSRIGGFASNELLRIMVAVPALNNTNRFQAHNPMFGSNALSGELTRTRLASFNLPGLRMWNADLVLRAPSLPTGSRLVLVDIVDDQGRPARQFRVHLGTGGFCHYQLDLPRDAETLHLLLTAPRSRLVEFTVQPSRTAGSSANPGLH